MAPVIWHPPQQCRQITACWNPGNCGGHAAPFTAQLVPRDMHSFPPAEIVN
jgi:hypothetical protein